jgi:hypothetical protein
VQIFLSHSSRDKALVREIRRHLPDHVKTWLDEEELLVGQDLEVSIKSAISEETDFVVIFLGKEAIHSEWVRRELNWSLEREKKIGRVFVLPVLLDDVWDEVEPEGFRDRLYLKCLDQSADGVRNLARQLSDNIFAWLSRNFDESKNKGFGSKDGVIDVMRLGVSFGKRRLVLSKNLQLLSKRLRNVSADKIISLIEHKIHVHTAVFAYPNPSSIISINDIYFGRFSWDEYSIICHEIFEIPEDTDINLWKQWSMLQSEYILAYSSEYRQPNSEPTVSSLKFCKNRLSKILTSATQIIASTETYNSNTNKVLIDRLKNTLDVIDFEDRSRTARNAVVQMETALSTCHDIIKRLMPRVISI